MEKREVIKGHFEDFFEEKKGTMGNRMKMGFRYNDKKLLKEGKYLELADEQIKKAKTIPLVTVSSLLICFIGALNFLMTEAIPPWIQITGGALMFIGSLSVVYFATKEYYSIKSSMTLLKKMIRAEEV